MPSHHHVNLGVLPGQTEAEEDFLVDVLGYRRVPDEERPKGRGLRWFRADDGSEIHLSVDAEHRPAARAHVAVDYGPDLAEVEARLTRDGIDHETSDTAGFPLVVNCCDPAGNLWELRGLRVEHPA